MKTKESLETIFPSWAKKDWNAVEGALADGFVFTSPFDDQIDKRTYQQSAGPMPKKSKGMMSIKLSRMGTKPLPDISVG